MKQPLKTAALTAALFLAGTAFGEGTPDPVQPIVTGTAHEALFGIAFDGQTGAAVGAAGAILETADGGKNWKTVKPAPSELSLLGVSVRKSRQIAVGQGGLVITSDAGDAWEKVDSGTQERLFAVSLNGSGLAVAVGSFGTVLKSGDAGKTWKSIAPESWKGFAEEGVQPHLYDVSVDDAGTITIAGEFGLILRSSDGGASWKLAHKGEASVFALELRADGGGYAVGQSGSILKTSDHGASWQALTSGSEAILLGVRSSPNGQVYVTGMHDMLHSADDGKTWQHVASEGISSAWYEGASGPAGDSGAIAVGHSGQIVRLGG